MKRAVLYLVLILLTACGAPQRAQYAMTLGDYQEAAVYYEEALRQNPESILLRNKLGRAYFEMKKYEKAEALYAETRALSSDEPVATFYLGLTRIALGKREAGFATLLEYKVPGGLYLTKAVHENAERLRKRPDLDSDTIIAQMRQAMRKGQEAEDRRDRRLDHWQ